MIDDDDIKKHQSYKKMLAYYNGNVDRVLSWFRTKNVHLPREISPAEMLELGKDDLLTKWIEDCISGFKR